MKRFHSLVVLACLSSGAMAADLPAPDGPAGQPHGKMNVLFLVIDDLNTWLLANPGRYEGRVVTPNIQRFAKSGVCFTRAYCASPKCSPSRTAFLTGVAPWSSGHTDNGLDIKKNPVLAKATSLPKRFQDDGYFMVSSGKIAHGYDTGVDWDTRVKHKRDPAPPGAPLNGFARAASGRVTEGDWGPTHLDESEMNDTKVADCAIEALKTKHDKPFFIACGLFHPHMPWYVPKKYFDMYPLDQIDLPPLKENDLDDIPAAGRKLISGTYESAVKHKQYRKGVQAYLATTSYADFQMGRVLDALEKSAYRDNTIVVLLSDHGFHVGAKEHWQKGTLWEDAAGCLLMVRVPGVTKPGQVCTRPVSLLDIYPTFAELAGWKMREPVAGRSLVPLLEDVNAVQDHPVITVYQNHASVRTEKYRLIRYDDGSVELYDHGMDPNEWNNLASVPELNAVKTELAGRLPEVDMLPYRRKGKNKHD